MAPCCAKKCFTLLNRHVVLARARRLSSLDPKERYTLLSNEINNSIEFDAAGQQTVQHRVHDVPVCATALCSLSSVGSKLLSEIRTEAYLNKNFQKAEKVEVAPQARTQLQLNFVRAMEELIHDYGESIPHLSVRNPRKDTRRKRRKAEDAPARGGSDVETFQNPTEESSGGDLDDEDLEHLEELRNTGDLRVPVFIPGGLFACKKAVLQEFVETGVVQSDMKINYFRQLWDRLYWHVVIKKCMPFAKCDECVDFRLQLLAAGKDEAKKEEVSTTAAALNSCRSLINDLLSCQVRKLQKVHRDQACLGRSRLAVRESLARRLPKLFGNVYDDAMDNTKVQCRFVLV